MAGRIGAAFLVRVKMLILNSANWKNFNGVDRFAEPISTGLFEAEFFQLRFSSESN